MALTLREIFEIAPETIQNKSIYFERMMKNQCHLQLARLIPILGESYS